MIAKFHLFYISQQLTSNQYMSSFTRKCVTKYVDTGKNTVNKFYNHVDTDAESCRNLYINK